MGILRKAVVTLDGTMLVYDRRSKNQPEFLRWVYGIESAEELGHVFDYAPDLEEVWAQKAALRSASKRVRGGEGAGVEILTPRFEQWTNSNGYAAILFSAANTVKYLWRVLGTGSVELLDLPDDILGVRCESDDEDDEEMAGCRAIKKLRRVGLPISTHEDGIRRLSSR